MSEQSLRLEGRGTSFRREATSYFPPFSYHLFSLSTPTNEAPPPVVPSVASRSRSPSAAVHPCHPLPLYDDWSTVDAALREGHPFLSATTLGDRHCQLARSSSGSSPATSTTRYTHSPWSSLPVVRKSTQTLTYCLCSDLIRANSTPVSNPLQFPNVFPYKFSPSFVVMFLCLVWYSQFFI